MAPLNRKSKAGLAALGLSLASASLAPGQEAAPPIPATMPAQAPSDAPAFAVLLLSNGRILQGNVSEAPAGDAYELHLKGGSIPVLKKDVVKRYRSMVAMYEDKAAHLAERDPDERMKLALWCLEQHMEAQAREQLQAVLAINPGDRRAARMVANIDGNAQRAAARDPEVRAAAAEVVANPSREREPAAMAVPRPRTVAGRSAERPVIFDLPADVATRRFVEFAWDVHPILQASCGSCHNESYQGDFRLLGRSRREWTADVVRANLDATLRYVRRDDPVHSDLVAYAANPHGPSPRPVFSGPNDRRYQRLVAWLGMLKVADEVAKVGSVPQSPAPSSSPAAEGFGADRLPGVSTNPTPTPVPMPGPSPFGGIPGQSLSESYPTQVVAPGVPADVRFDATSFPGSLKSPLPPLPGPTTTGPPPSGRAVKAPAATPAAVPSTPPQGTPVPPPDDVIPPTNRAKKSNKVDPALLEKLMKGRQQGQP